MLVYYACWILSIARTYDYIWKMFFEVISPDKLTAGAKQNIDGI